MCAIGCRSCASWAWIWKTGGRTRTRSGSTASSWQRQKPGGVVRRLRRPPTSAEQKQDRSDYGEKNYVNADQRHTLIRRFKASDAAPHERQVIDDLLDDDDAASDVWADSAYRSAEIEKTPGERGLTSRIHRMAHRNRPLIQRAQRGNKTWSKVRARAEHHPRTPVSGAD